MANRRGRPATGRTWRPLQLSMTPDRVAVAEAIGPSAAKGIYALLDFAAKNPAILAKVRSQVQTKSENAVEELPADLFGELSDDNLLLEACKTIVKILAKAKTIEQKS